MSRPKEIKHFVYGAGKPWQAKGLYLDCQDDNGIRIEKAGGTWAQRK